MQADARILQGRCAGQVQSQRPGRAAGKRGSLGRPQDPLAAGQQVAENQAGRRGIAETDDILQSRLLDPFRQAAASRIVPGVGIP